MYKIIHQGVDTLDVALAGTLPKQVIDELMVARQLAETMHNDDHGVSVCLGPNKRKFFVKGQGKKGGYYFVIVDDPTGAIFSVKKNAQRPDWNFFVSARAAGLLSRSYEGMKRHIAESLTDIGAVITDVSVNRIDYAIDIATPEFVLEMENFIAPRKSKVGCYFTNGFDMDDLGNPVGKHDSEVVGSVMRGGRFESVTVGKMPGRQVTLYDKLQAAKDLKTDYWFPAWKIDPRNPGTQVWRVELRAGKKGLERYIRPPQKRNYETVDAVLPEMLCDAVRQIRYAYGGRNLGNVTRSEVHPLWLAAQEAVSDLPHDDVPALPPEYVLELMRKQRHAMAESQAFGNLNNMLVLEGYTEAEIQSSYARLAADRALKYQDGLGKDLHRKKLDKTLDRLSIFVPTD